jgi:TPR repeat protein
MSLYVDLYSKARCGKVDAFKQLEALSDEGDRLASGYLAMILHRSPIMIIPRDKPRAALLIADLLPWLFEVEHDDGKDAPDIWYLLGFCFFEGIVVGKEKQKKSIHYYQLAFEREHALAQCALGNCYDVGDVVKQDLSRAVSYYKMSADQGFPVAQCNYSMCNEYGEGCEANQAIAVEYAQLAADQGYVDSLYTLSMYYFYGNGVHVDPVKATHYCKEGADQGDLECMYILGDCYMRGYVVEQDKTKGIQLLLSGAERNHDLCQVYVANCFLSGHGLEKDVIEGVRYLRRLINGPTNDDNAEYPDNVNGENSREEAKRLLIETQEEYKEQVI